MKINKKLSLLSIILILSVLLVACGNKGADTNTGEKASESTNTSANDKDAKSESEPVPAQTEYRDTLNIALTAQPPTLDAALTVSAVALDTAGYIFEQLYALDSDYQPTPVLAESVEISADGLTYTFPLRKGVKFHNGKELSAADVVASMNRWITLSSRAKVLLTNAKFEEVDNYTVKLTVEKPSSDVLIIISTQAQFPAIIPKEIIEAAPAEGITEYIGTGPYKFQEWKQDQYIHLVRYDEYQSVDAEPSGFVGRKDAPTANLYFHFVTDHSTRIAGVKTGKYDIADSIPIENYDELVNEQDLELLSFPGGALTAFLNTSEGLLASDVKYRQAILAALNNEEIMLASFAKPELYSLAPGYLSTSSTLWSNDAGKEYYNQANPDKAKQLLKEAGYNGEEITLHTTKDYNEMYTATLVIQEQLRQVGFNVKVESYDFPTFLEVKGDRTKWDLFVASTGFQLTPPQLLAVNPDWAGLNNDTVKNALVAIRAAATPEDAKKEWEKLQGFLYEFGSSTVIGHYNGVVAISKSLEGFENFEAPIAWNAKIAK